MKQKKLPEPLVSVIIPTYNGASHIKKCLKSVLNQKYTNYEIIVVDDCSEDKTKSVVESLKIRNIKLFKTNKNSGGPAVPRNLGISKARGKYIAFLDDDDLWEKNKLKLCINKMKNEHDFCYHQLKQKNNKVLKKHNIDITKSPAKFLLHYGPIPTTSAIVVRKKTIQQVKGFCESKQLIAGEDYDCWLRIAKAQKKFCFIKKPLGTYGHIRKKISNPTNALRILKAIKQRHFSSKNQIPFWIHKSMIKNLFITNGIFAALKYIYKERRWIFQKNYFYQKIIQ